MQKFETASIKRTAITTCICAISMALGAAARWWYERTKLRVDVVVVVGVAGAFLAQLLGGWDVALQTLVSFMSVDFGTGLICAAIFHKSPKTAGGALSSSESLRGLFKKGGMLLLVYIACRLDLLIGSNYIRDAVITALITNELISIIENLGLMGVPIPAVLSRTIEALKHKNDEEDKK